MSEELDPGVLRAFAAEPPPAPSEAFVQAVGGRIAGHRRSEGAARTAAMVLAALAAPAVAFAVGPALQQAGMSLAATVIQVMVLPGGQVGALVLALALGVAGRSVAAALRR